MSWQWLNVNFILQEKISQTSFIVFFSRFNDLKERKQIVFSKNEIISKCWIVTNNRFTSDAIAFEMFGDEFITGIIRKTII
jgi:hypothetical protein